MASKKATVDKSTTIRAASKNKQRSQGSSKASAASPFGSSNRGSLASSLSSLFSPQPHGKDAALASLLASSSKPPVNLGQGSRFAAFGSFPSAQSSAISTSKSTSQTLDDKQKVKKKNAPSAQGSIDTTAPPGQPSTASGPAASTSSRTNDQQKKQKQTDTVGSRRSDVRSPTGTSLASSSKPVVPNPPAGRRPIFRPVLASSTAVSWPEMPVAGSKTVLHTLLEMLAKPALQYTLRKDLGRRSLSRPSKAKEETDDTAMDVDNTSQLSTAGAGPQVLAGINSITRAIENDIAADLEKLHSAQRKGKTVAAQSPSIKVVFVCRHDLPQPALIAHLPMLVTARNAVLQACSNDDNETNGAVYLFALPSGSEELLAKALNLRRASILALTSAFSPTHLAQILAAIERETGSLCRLRASWLETAMRAAKQFSANNQRPLTLKQQPPTIKLLRTTQPVDLNASKAAKKSRRKERSARWKKRKMQTQQRIKSLRAELKQAVQKERNAKKKAAGRVQATKAGNKKVVQM
ncbi:hypothetical protein NDA17_007532 [Ustilago hordei]|nr:hypothetical protein NDA17_007532 [Ustilago hordei]